MVKTKDNYSLGNFKMFFVPYNPEFIFILPRIQF